MGNLKFSILMLKKEKIKSIVYIITMAFTIAVTFLFFNIIDNPYIMDDPNQVSFQAGVIVPFSTLLAFMVIMFCAAMISFACNFYVSRKTKEIAIMEMSGSGFIKATMYLFYQDMIMTFIAIPLGLTIGAMDSIITNALLYQAMNSSMHGFYLPLQAISDTLIYIFIILFTQLIYVAGYIHRNDIALLLSQEQRNDLIDQRLIQLPNGFYILVYIVGIVIFFLTPYTPTSSIFPSCIGMAGIGGILKYCFSGFVKKIKQKNMVLEKLG